MKYATKGFSIWKKHFGKVVRQGLRSSDSGLLSTKDSPSYPRKLKRNGLLLTTITRITPFKRLWKLSSLLL